MSDLYPLCPICNEKLLFAVTNTSTSFNEINTDTPTSKKLDATVSTSLPFLYCEHCKLPFHYTDSFQDDVHRFTVITPFITKYIHSKRKKIILKMSIDKDYFEFYKKVASRMGIPFKNLNLLHPHYELHPIVKEDVSHDE